MVRIREFDPNEALEAAMETFWELGYQATSIDDLVHATGVSRYGLYTAFGNKHQLFQAALGSYRKRLASVLEPLAGKDAALPEVLAFFEHTRKEWNQPTQRLGCLLGNTATELSRGDDAIAAIVHKALEELKRLFEKALLRARNLKQVSPKLNPEASAAHLLTVQIGLNAMLRAGLDRNTLNRSLDTALDHLH